MILLWWDIVVDRTLAQIPQVVLLARVQHYCSSCPECQLVQPWGLKGVCVLCYLPIVTVLFGQLDIDIVGPLIYTINVYWFLSILSPDIWKLSL